MDVITKLNDVVNYAARNNAFYKGRYLLKQSINSMQDFRNLCIIEKKDLRQSEECISIPYQRFPLNEQIMYTNTSGTTGECLRMVWDRYDYFKSNLSAAFFRNKHYGISPNSHYLSFFSTLHSENKIKKTNPLYQYAKNGRQLMLNKAFLTNIHELDDMIQTFSPVWMIVQPSILMLLHEMKCHWLHNLSYIETIGEMLLDSQRILIEKTYHAKVVNNYGTTETSYIAMECPQGAMHILEDNVFLEIEPQENSTYGNIIVTNMRNRAMPIIRYRNGDQGRLINTPCKCGCQTQQLELCGGRSSEYIIDGTQKISWYPILNVIENANEEYGQPIWQIQIIQSDRYRLVFHIVLSPLHVGWENSIRKLILEELKEKKLFENFDIEFVFRENIDWNCSKTPMFTNHYARNMNISNIEDDHEY